MIVINNKGFTFFETAILIAIISIAIIPIYKMTFSLMENRSKSIEISNRQNSISEVYDYIILDITKDFNKYLNENIYKINKFNVKTHGRLKYPEHNEHINRTKNIIIVDVKIYTAVENTEVSNQTLLIDVDNY